ncbi:hypothetical protein JKP88DRAFT_247974 [Tribonema minus]|uniref:Uncharacterized protein n=1 Tax=Tribonema minus TaxID=303371 RepID=A0A836CA35_9STRA|nr:hypothetical protein JKP88DRAFT_247974 [Tribonema minus]
MAALNWGCNDAATRLLIHIADAPCHGTSYHSMADSHPSGAPYGQCAADLLQALSNLSIEYIFGRLNSSTDTMVAKFNDEIGGAYIKLCDMADVRKITKSVVTATRGTMARTAKTGIGGRRPIIFKAGAATAARPGAIADEE